jgi:hypothetical protein
MAAFNAGRNVTIEIKGTKLTATIDLSVDAPLSTSGKTESIATTGAPADIGALPDGRPAKLNLSLFAPVRVENAEAAGKRVAAVKAAKEARDAAKA